VSPTDLQKLAVVIPALNEEACLPLVLAALPAVGHVLVVDNGSTDRTQEVARAGGAVVLVQPIRGYGGACQVGIQAAAQRGAEVVIILDADHSFDPLQMATLAQPILNDQADMVLGDRTVTAEPGALTPQQRFGNRVATALIRGITGHRYRDMGPFRAIRTRSLVAMQLCDPDFGWNVEMQIKAIRVGLRVLEVPVSCRARQAGQSKISGSLRGSAAAGFKMMRATWRYAR
jgi:glycosyltransferase involved in cell wall biosynthesis